MWHTTEQPKGIDAGILKFVGTDEEIIYKTFKQVLDDKDDYEKMSKANNSF
jgi:UDP-N-acetylglucosamine 2-epimerase (non-hydrolysing)